MNIGTVSRGKGANNLAARPWSAIRVPAATDSCVGLGGVDGKQYVARLRRPLLAAAVVAKE
ncbi:MAG TPA: hypothetical protein VFV18_00840 [Porticoccaceae bacterium]|nr:hypothetical protein [Porticoccaceae bacterium]